MSSWLGPVVSTGLSLLFNGRSQQLSDQYQLLNYQQRMNELAASKQRDWASSEAQKSRDFDKEMYFLNREYNSLPEMIARAKEAGVHPGSLLTAGQAASPAAQAPSAPSVPTGAAASGVTPLEVPNGMVNMQHLGSFINALASAAKLTKETSRYDEVTDAALKKMSQEVFHSMEETKRLQLLNQVQQMFGKRQAYAEWLKTYNEAILASKKGDTEEADKKLKQAQERLESIKGEQAEALKPLVISQMEEEIELIKQRQETEKSQQLENRASAYERSEAAKLHGKEAENQEAQAREHLTLADTKSYDVLIAKLKTAKVQGNEKYAETLVNTYFYQLEADYMKAGNDAQAEAIRGKRQDAIRALQNTKLGNAFDAMLNYLTEKVSFLVAPKL